MKREAILLSDFGFCTGSTFSPSLPCCVFWEADPLGISCPLSFGWNEATGDISKRLEVVRTDKAEE